MSDPAAFLVYWRNLTERSLTNSMYHNCLDYIIVSIHGFQNSFKVFKSAVGVVIMRYDKDIYIFPFGEYVYYIYTILQ